MEMGNLIFPYKFHEKDLGKLSNQIEEVYSFIQMVRDLPLLINNGFACIVTGHKEYIRIVPESLGSNIIDIQYDHNSKDKIGLNLDSVHENSYRFRYGKIVIDIEKSNEETKLQKKILDLEQRLKSQT